MPPPGPGAGASGAGSLAAPPLRPTPAPTARPVSTRDPLATATSATPAIPAGTAVPRSPTAARDATPPPPSLARVQSLRGLARDVVAELFRIDQQLVSTASALRHAEAELGQLTAETEALEAELAIKQAAVEARGAVYGVRLRAIYKFGRTSPLEEILSARDFGDALRRITMLQSVARIDNHLLGQLRAERDAILDTTNRLRDKQRAASDLRDQIDQQHQTLLTQYEAQSVVVRQAQEEQSQAEVALAAQQSSALAGSIVALQRQFQRELEALERQRPTPSPTGRPSSVPAARAVATPSPARPVPTAIGARTPAPTVATAPLQWPVANAVVTTEFGEPTFAQVTHSGIDLAQRLYSPVLAAADGIVLACGLAEPADRSLSYGMLVVVAHDRTVATLYAHLDDETALPPVRVGDTVKRGQIIGYVGLTGLTTGPHVHFEVRVAGQTQEPRDFLAR